MQCLPRLKTFLPERTLYKNPGLPKLDTGLLVNDILPFPSQFFLLLQEKKMISTGFENVIFKMRFLAGTNN